MRTELGVVDLKALAGNMYRTGLDEAAYCEGESKSDPQYVTISGRYGELYPYDEEKIVVHIYGARIARRLERELADKITPLAGGGEDTIFIFDKMHFREVVKYIKPRRKRGMSPEQRKACIDRLKEYRVTSTSGPVREPVTA